MPYQCENPVEAQQSRPEPFCFVVDVIKTASNGTREVVYSALLVFLRGSGAVELLVPVE